jgi:hypothetical protein
MSNAQGIRVVLVAAALIALLHGVILKALRDDPPIRKYVDRPGRPHDGRAHPDLGAQFLQSRDNDLREMFEFASQQSFRQDRAPTDWAMCASPPALDAVPEAMQMVACDGSSDGAAYVGAAVLNRYSNENPMNGGLVGGVGAYDDSVGFGGSML